MIVKTGGRARHGAVPPSQHPGGRDPDKQARVQQDESVNLRRQLQSEVPSRDPITIRSHLCQILQSGEDQP